MKAEAMKKLSIVFPCHNEERAIDEILTRLARVRAELLKSGLQTEVIVVDDGSSDGSRALLRSIKDIQLIVHDRAMGYGGALKSGFAVCQGDAILFLDMDRTYRVEDIPRMVEFFNSGNWDMVYGRRPFQNSGMPLFRQLGNAFFAWLIRTLLTSEISDVCTGMRIFPRGRLKEVLSLGRDGLNFSIQLTALSILKGWRITEVEIGYEDRVGKSKLSVFKDGFQFLYVVLSFRGWAK